MCRHQFGSVANACMRADLFRIPTLQSERHVLSVLQIIVAEICYFHLILRLTILPLGTELDRYVVLNLLAGSVVAQEINLLEAALLEAARHALQNRGESIVCERNRTCKFHVACRRTDVPTSTIGYWRSHEGVPGSNGNLFARCLDDVVVLT